MPTYTYDDPTLTYDERCFYYDSPFDEVCLAGKRKRGGRSGAIQKTRYRNPIKDKSVQYDIIIKSAVYAVNDELTQQPEEQTKVKASINPPDIKVIAAGKKDQNDITYVDISGIQAITESLVRVIASPITSSLPKTKNRIVIEEKGIIIKADVFKKK